MPLALSQLQHAESIILFAYKAMFSLIRRSFPTHQSHLVFSLLPPLQWISIHTRLNIFAPCLWQKFQGFTDLINLWSFRCLFCLFLNAVTISWFYSVYSRLCSGRIRTQRCTSSIGFSLAAGELKFDLSGYQDLSLIWWLGEMISDLSAGFLFFL